MVYLDHAATTPLLPEAVAAWTDQATRPGNASSLHTSGRRARRVVEESREAIAAALHVRPVSVVFTGGGTESDNLAVKGLYWAARQADPRRRRIIAARIEHKAVLDPIDWLMRHEGAVVDWLPVSADGRVPAAAVDEAIAADPGSVALVTLMWANNEVGTVQPIAAVAQICREYGVAFHTDAVQAVGQLPVSAEDIDALTLTAHKVGGPTGVGALVLDRSRTVEPLLHGGGQERDIRSGTLDVGGIAAFAAALRSTVARRPAEALRLARLRDDLVTRILAAVPDAVLTGPVGMGSEHRLPGIAHLSFPGAEGDSLLMLLDAAGVECSTGSACTAGVPRPSHVLAAMGVPPEVSRGSLRFSLGHTSTAADVDAVLAALPEAVARARRAGLVRVRAGV